MSYFKLNNLYFNYPNQKSGVIENFSMELEKGEIVALLGNSGSGKSTILRLIAGLEKPSSGKLIIDKERMFDENYYTAPQDRGVGMIFQDYSLFPNLTVIQNVAFGIKGKRKSEKIKIAMNYLKMVQLDDHSDKYPSECSGGQQQRIAIARALAAEPNILLLDEPFSNLDEELKVSVRKEIKDLLKKFKMSAILVTHDHNDVEAVADRVIKIS
ncbi:ABC transporter ATP-binding protein [Sedimentibacter sp. B4]|uniref:ABC transporter ATP-binding protein n=1 Tax=Sedimentibacter sp. B4 TaxID=304766 RepID=UPI0003022286|nr:ABC transporter ATP-binding protein [Sedimentibacter sp. B4]